MNIGVNCTIDEQCKLIEEIIEKNSDVFHVISTINRFELNNAYVAAGCIFQTVWNYISGYEINYGINDIDIIYYDNSDLSYEAEAIKIEQISKFYSGIRHRLDIKNEARVHLWYNKKFGKQIQQYASSESAINSWIPAAAIGVNYEEGQFKLYVPYGLNDLFGKVVRPNKLLSSKEYFEEKSKKWKSKWNDITIIDW